jgi:outer membrane protein OmpA-like peptidoglycan-associated protein
MKTGIIAIAAAALIANTSYAAPKFHKDKPHNHEENVGVGSGAGIGAIAGGPVGMVIGMAVGGWMGNKWHDERRETKAIEARAEDAEKLSAKLKDLLADSEDEVSQLHLVMLEQKDTYRQALSDAMNIEVYFKTGESTLDAQVAERLGKLGKLVGKFDDFSIVVEGHADPRGEEAYNDDLSAQRAAAVREALISAGLPADRITTRAEGERGSTAAEGDLDAMALERRVNLSIVSPIPRENRVAQQ